MTRLLACLAVLGGVAIAGCSSDTTLDTDSGVVLPDVGASAADGSTLPIDAGSGSDASSGSDAFQPPRDAGPPLDAGPAPDLGNILPPNDAGSPFGDSGTLGDPAWAPLTVRIDGTTCTPVVPCGGNVVGTWDVSGGCVAIDLSAIMRCPGATATASGMARGRVTFDATIAHRVAESEVDLQVTVPSLCAGFVGGCAGLETRLQMAVPQAACTTQSDMSCYCQARYVSTIDDTDGYSTMNDEIVGATSGKTWAYCVTGNMLSYEDNSPMGMREPGIVDLTMR